MTRTPREIHALALVIATALAACASAPPPLGLLDDAGEAVRDAREARADEFAPVDLGLAEEKLASARFAMQEGDYADARVLAEQAELNALLAAARSRAADGRAQVQRASEENARLRRELLDEGNSR